MRVKSIIKMLQQQGYNSEQTEEIQKISLEGRA